MSLHPIYVRVVNMHYCIALQFAHCRLNALLVVRGHQWTSSILNYRPTSNRTQ